MVRMDQQRASGHETSGSRIGRQGLVAAGTETAGALRERVRQERLRGWDLVCVEAPDGRLLGTLTAQDLLAAPADQPLARAARRDGPRVRPGMDQEKMASLALHHGIAAMPVVDDAGRLVGGVGSHALMDLLRREHVEDLHRLAGISREASHLRQTFQAPPLRTLRHRLPWLLVGLAGSVLATWVMAGFESVLAAQPVLALFVPGLVYLADAIGTQSETIAVRGLSLSHQPFRQLAAGELRTGTSIGAVLAGLAFPLVWAVFGDFRLALAIALALGAASIVAALLGLAMPCLLDRLGADPAYGSGPIATILQDLLSLLIYFGCVSLVVLRMPMAG